MSVVISMPQLGLTMESGIVQRCLKQKGDTVHKDEIVFNISTDKLSHDVPSPIDGVILELLASEGSEYPVGAPLAYVGEVGEQVESSTFSTEIEEKNSIKSVVTREENSNEALCSDTILMDINKEERKLIRTSSAISPKAKKMAHELGVSTEKLKGTGPRGWIVAADILKASEQLQKKGTKETIRITPLASKIAGSLGIDLAQIETQDIIRKKDVLNAANQLISPRKSSVFESASEKRLPASQMRRIIGERMTESSRIPSVSFEIEVDFTETIALLHQLNHVVPPQNHTKITYNDVIMKFCSVALLETPMMNARLDGEYFILNDHVNIGLAVALDGGLIVPNLRNVEKKGIRRIASERREMVERAKNGTLSPEECTGGTFTVSNLGMFGITSFIPLINPPEAAILGISSIREKLFLEGKDLVKKPICIMTLTVDHRIVDGADAARFLSRLRQITESPVEALI